MIEIPESLGAEIATYLRLSPLAELQAWANVLNPPTAQNALELSLTSALRAGASTSDVIALIDVDRSTKIKALGSKATAQDILTIIYDEPISLASVADPLQ